MLARILGDVPESFTDIEAAKASKTQFVRSASQLAFLDPSSGATGHRMSAWEAYQAFGLNAIREAADFGSAILQDSSWSPGATVKEAREALGVDRQSLTRQSGVDKETVKAIEAGSRDLDVRMLERCAFALGLDERLVATRESTQRSSEVAYRLKTLLKDKELEGRSLSKKTAMIFAEASSVIRTQVRLRSWLGLNTEKEKFDVDSNYGSPMSQAWQKGYLLAEHARQLLGIGEGPIPSLKKLVEDRLGIPVIQAELPEYVSGATVVTVDDDYSEARGIVLNTQGENRNVWVRRATLAHEVGHLLFDSVTELKPVRIDTYQNTDGNAEIGEGSFGDVVEQRANAFAIAFLAPIGTVRSMTVFENGGSAIAADSVRRIMTEFGLSRTAAMNHVHNANHRQFELSQDYGLVKPSDEWRSAEDFTLDYFPIKSTPIQRRGLFAGLVAESCSKRLISDDTAALYLQCEVSELIENLEYLRQIFPVA